MMETWMDFARLEDEHYAAMFAEYNREYEEDTEDDITLFHFWVEWESEEEWCEDIESFDCETEEEALDLFWEAVAEGRLTLPKDARVTKVTNTGVA